MPRFSRPNYRNGSKNDESLHVAELEENKMGTSQQRMNGTKVTQSGYANQPRYNYQVETFSDRNRTTPPSKQVEKPINVETQRNANQQRAQEEKRRQEMMEQQRMQEEKRRQEMMEQQRMQEEKRREEMMEQQRMQEEKRREEMAEQQRIQEEKIRQEIMNQQRMQEEKMRGEMMNQQRIQEDKIKQQMMEQQRMYEDKMRQQMKEQQSLCEEKLRKERMNQERMNEDRLREEMMRQEDARLEMAKQDDMCEQKMREEMMKQQKMYETKMREDMMKQKQLYEEKLRKERMEQNETCEDRMRKEMMNQKMIWEEKMQKEMMNQNMMCDERMQKEMMNQNLIHEKVTEKDYAMQEESCEDIVKRRIKNREVMNEDLNYYNVDMDNYNKEDLDDYNNEEYVMDARDMYSKHSCYKTPCNTDERPETYYKSCNKNQSPVINHVKVRILHAAVGFEPIFVVIGNRPLADGLSFGKISSYDRVMDGFGTVMVYNHTSKEKPLCTSVIPFMAGSKVTLAVVNSVRGMQVIQIPDNVCRGRSKDRGTFRVANLTFDDGPFDITLSDGTLVFSDINVKEVTVLKQALAGDYDFHVSRTPVNLMNTSNAYAQNLQSEEGTHHFNFYQRIQPDKMYTACIIGGHNTSTPLQILVIENEVV